MHPPLESPRPETDPVCGMRVDPARAAGQHAFAGRTYYFCNPHCLERFRANPESYLRPAPAPPAAVPGDYVCPMHPEVVRSEPGSCPICGMALEPRTAAAVEERNPEREDLTRRFWATLVLTVPVFVLAMTDMLPGRPLHIPPRAQGLLEMALATPVVLWGACPFFLRMWASFLHRRPTLFTLIGLGTGAAYLFS